MKQTLLWAFAYVSLTATFALFANAQPTAPQPTPAPTVESSDTSTATPATAAAPTVAETPAPPVLPKEDKRILGVIPNYRTVPSRDLSIPPLTPKQKFTIATKDSFDPPGFGTALFYASINQLENTSPSWGQGIKGLSKRYVAGFADQAISNYLSEAIVPVVFHQDPRYFRSHTGTKWQRVGYAASRVLIIRSDKGTNQLNVSELLGTGMAVGISNLYYPSEERNVSSNLTKFCFQVSTDAGFNIVKEFWPDIRNKLFKKKSTSTD